MTIDFEDCNNAELSYQLNEGNVSGDISVTRVIPQGGAVCEALLTTE